MKQTAATALLLLCACSEQVAEKTKAEPLLLTEPAAVFGVEHPLFEIRAAAAAPRASVVLTAPEPAVHVFPADGGEPDAFGAEGSGPAELENPVDVALLDDVLYVLDMQASGSRIVAFTVEGDHVETITIPGLVSRIEVRGTGLIAEVGAFGESRRTLLDVRSRDTIARYEEAVRLELTAEEGPVRRYAVRPPFTATAQWSASRDGSMAFWPGTGYHVLLLDAHGTARDSIALPRDSLAVSAAARDAWIASTFSPDIELFGRRDPFRGFRANAAEQIDFPAFYPPVLKLFSFPDGSIWALRAAHPGELWLQISGVGAGRSVRLPHGGELLAADDERLLLRTVDDLGVETVELHDIAILEGTAEE